MTTTTNVATRKITIFSTQGNTRKVYNSDVKTWEELSLLLSNDGFMMDALRAIENVRHTELSVPTAVLPTMDFTLFLSPKKPFSGALDLKTASFKEMRSLLKEVDGLKDKLIAEVAPENWTRLPKETLRAALISIMGNSEDCADEEQEPEEISTEDVITSLIGKLQTLKATIRTSEEDEFLAKFAATLDSCGEAVTLLCEAKLTEDFASEIEDNIQDTTKSIESLSNMFKEILLEEYGITYEVPEEDSQAMAERDFEREETRRLAEEARNLGL